MNTLFVGHHIGRHGLRLVQFAVLASVSSTSHPAPDWFAVYSDGELLEKGATAYGARDCPTALPYLYAYVQRRPSALSNSAKQREALLTSLNACDNQVRGSTSGGKGDSAGGAGAKANLPRVTFAKPVVVAAPPAMAGAIGRCDIYASIAVAQQRANLTQRCGLNSSQWSDQYRYHYDWCAGGISAAETGKETAQRQQQLEACRP